MSQAIVSGEDLDAEGRRDRCHISQGRYSIRMSYANSVLHTDTYLYVLLTHPKDSIGHSECLVSVSYASPTDILSTQCAYAPPERASFYPLKATRRAGKSYGFTRTLS